jgi:hypothetical protein
LLPNVFLVNFKYNNNHLTEINFILHFLTKYYYSYFFISTIFFFDVKKISENTTPFSFNIGTSILLSLLLRSCSVHGSDLNLRSILFSTFLLLLCKLLLFVFYRDCYSSLNFDVVLVFLLRFLRKLNFNTLI